MKVVRVFISIVFLSTNLAQEFNLHTGADLVYTNFYPITTGSTIKFKVKAKNDAFVTFVPKPVFNKPYIEVTFGGWHDTKSQMRRDRKDPAANMAYTPGFLNGGNKSAGFWIRLEGAGVMVGQENQKVPFMSWVDPDPINISYFTVSTGFESEGEWKIKVEKNSDLFCGPNNELVEVKGENTNAPVKKQYLVMDEVKSWDEAKAACEARGQRLASVKSRKEQRQLEQAIEERKYPFSGVWIAANDRGRFGQFVWYDGSNDDVTYTNWQANQEPSREADSGKNCVFLSYVDLVVKQNAYWFLQKCTDTWNFVCESYN